MGRRAMTPEQKEARGNPGKRPIVKTAKVGVIRKAALTRPDWLTDEIALQVWDQTHEQLHYLRDSDVHVFGRYCVYMAGWIDATDKIRETGGSVYETSSAHVENMMRINPWFTVRSRLEDDLVKIEEKLGLTPLDRQRIIVQLAAAAQRPMGDLFNQAANDPDGGDEAPALPAAAVAEEVDTIGGLRNRKLDG